MTPTPTRLVYDLAGRPALAESMQKLMADVPAVCGVCGLHADRTAPTDRALGDNFTDRKMFRDERSPRVCPACVWCCSGKPPATLRLWTIVAATGDYQAGADLLGMGYDQFCGAVARARRRAFALWHEGETPCRRWRKDVRVGSRTAVRPTHCPKGHPYDETNTAYARNGAIRCKRCHREREAARRAGTHRKQQLKPCGTYAAWQRHRYHGEPVDPACEAARQAYMASRRKTPTVAA